MSSNGDMRAVRTFLGSNFDIFYYMLTLMLLPRLINWASINHEFRGHAQNEFRRRLNVLLQPFIWDVPAMLRVMMRTRTVISGSAVLPAIDPSNHVWSRDIKDVDLYTCHCYYPELVDFLVQREGYVISQEDSRISDADVPHGNYLNGFAGSAIHSVIVLLRERDGRRIDVVVANSDYNSTLPIFKFDMSIVMNFISPTLVFVGYPQYTFDKRGLININAVDDHIGLQGPSRPWNVKPVNRYRLDKYRARGFTLAFTPQAWDDRHSVNCRFGGDCTGLRATNDGQCLIFPFGMSGAYDDGLAYHWDGVLPGGHVEWSLGGTDCIIVGMEVVYPSACFPIQG